MAFSNLIRVLPFFMKVNHTSTDAPFFELKGSVLTIIVLHIKKIDADQLYRQLAKKIGQARSFFNNAPVLIDLGAVDEEGQAALDFPFLVDTLRRSGLMPVGVCGQAPSQSERVLAAGLGLLPAVKNERPVEASLAPPPPEAESPSAAPPPEPVAPVARPAAATAPTKVITQPVRSGQQVFAPQGDLVILSSVNAGAEVLAAGNIHVYGALRGRAMAGINGDIKARIFSLQCNPELVAVAGEYRVNELLPKDLINQSVLVFLENGRLRFEVIGSFYPLA